MGSIKNVQWAMIFWEAIGITGAVIFCGRFYVQWWYSERKKKVVVPVAFWYMSAIGSLMLLPYAVFKTIPSPVGALSHTFNIIVYARNLMHIWNEAGTLSRRRYWMLHGATGVIVLIAMVLMCWTWWREFDATQSGEQQATVWIWIAVGTLGQFLFGCRFLVQWLVTEAKKKSVMPVAFWYLSLAAATLMIAAFVIREEWILAFPVAAPIPVYLRNLYLARHPQKKTP